MKIVLCEPHEFPLVAYEEQAGSREGAFFLDGDGLVRFSHPGDGHVWFAAPDAGSFRGAVAMWSRYLEASDGSGAASHLAALKSLREGLSRLGVLPDRADALWPVLLEQAEAGLL